MTTFDVMARSMRRTTRRLSTQGGAGAGAGAGADGARVPPGFEDLFRTQRLSMVRLAVLLVDDQASAEDVVQDAFVAVHRNWTRLRDEQASVAYLRTAVVNTARSALRRRQSQRRTLRGAEPDVGPAADAEVLLREEHQEVLAALRTLPERQREVLVLRYWSDLSEKQIAETLGISAGTVKSSAARGLTALEQVLVGGTR